jgi:hypothetical protein
LLFTDKIFVTTNDLMRIDGETQVVADNESITLEGDNGLIRAGIEETANELQKLMVAFGGYLNSGDLTANHLAAVLNVGIGNSVRVKAALTQVCVSSDTGAAWNWIKQFAVFWTLRIFYRNAFARTVNDRYEKKMNLYKDELTRRVQPTLFGLGIPIVLRPLYAPASYFTRNSGSWDYANVSLVPGNGTLDGTQCDVVISYVDMSQANLYLDPSNVNNAESELADRITVNMSPGNVISVDISTLVPPTGIQDPAQVLVVVVSPLKATHWNVYVSPVAGGVLFLQNTVPIPIDVETYTLDADPIFSGPTAGLGQWPTRRLSLVPMRQRA